MTPAEANHLLDRSATARCLTDRQVQTLGLIADGRTVPEIAAELGISPGTVKMHIAQAKMHVRLYEVRQMRVNR